MTPSFYSSMVAVPEEQTVMTIVYPARLQMYYSTFPQCTLIHTTILVLYHCMLRDIYGAVHNKMTVTVNHDFFTLVCVPYCRLFYFSIWSTVYLPHIR